MNQNSDWKLHELLHWAQISFLCFVSWAFIYELVADLTISSVIRSFTAVEIHSMYRVDQKTSEVIEFVDWMKNPRTR